MSAGSSAGGGSNTFKRDGTTTTEGWRVFTDAQKSLIDGYLSNTQPTQSSKLNSMLSSLVDTSSDNRLGFNKNTFQGLIGEIGSNYTGRAGLEQTAQLNPNSEIYADNTYEGYLAKLKNTLSDVNTGPGNVRGGENANALRESTVLSEASLGREELVRKARLEDLQAQAAATQMLRQLDLGGTEMRGNLANVYNAQKQGQDALQIEGGKLIEQGQISYGNMLPFLLQTIASSGSKQTEAYEGFGSQTSNTSSQGFNLCCFIFMQAYNGQMPYWVRQCRDEFAPESSTRRAGYIRMSKWLVPAMQKSLVVRSLVNLLMIKPLSFWGGYYKKVPNYQFGFIFKPFVLTWFKIWSIYGR